MHQYFNHQKTLFALLVLVNLLGSSIQPVHGIPTPMVHSIQKDPSESPKSWRKIFNQLAVRVIDLWCKEIPVKHDICLGEKPAFLFDISSFDGAYIFQRSSYSMQETKEERNKKTIQQQNGLLLIQSGYYLRIYIATPQEIASLGRIGVKHAFSAISGKVGKTPKDIGMTREVGFHPDIQEISVPYKSFYISLEKNTYPVAEVWEKQQPILNGKKLVLVNPESIYQRKPARFTEIWLSKNPQKLRATLTN